MYIGKANLRQLPRNDSHFTKGAACGLPNGIHHTLPLELKDLLAFVLGTSFEGTLFILPVD